MHRSLLIAIASLGLLLLPGCGSDDDGSSAAQSGGDGPATLRVGTLPIGPSAALRLGIEEGFFEEEGLQLEVQEFQSGPAIAASVVSGENQIGFAANVPVLQAQARGIPIKVIAPINTVSGNQGLMVTKDSPIRTPADLNGKRIGVVALKAVDDLSVRAAADKRGADSSTFEFVSIPFPEMLAALHAGRVDAVQVTEPFYTAALKAGDRAVIEDPNQVFGPDGNIGVYFTSTEFLDGNRGVIDRFVAALSKSNVYATEHPEAVAEIMPKFTEIPPDVAAEIRPERFPAQLNVASLRVAADLMVEYGFVDERPDVDELVYQPGGGEAGNGG